MACLVRNVSDSRTYGRPSIIFQCRNAGLFVWVDLRSLFDETPSAAKDAPTSAKEIKHSIRDYGKLETEFCKLCESNGVMVAPGSIYLPETQGSCRITFTVDADVLDEGLKRVARAITQIKASAHVFDGRRGWLCSINSKSLCEATRDMRPLLSRRVRSTKTGDLEGVERKWRAVVFHACAAWDRGLWRSV